MNRLEVIKLLHEALPELRERRGVQDLWIFGSTARNEAGPDSDVDILVSLEEGVDLFAFVGIKLELEELLGIKVDLGTWKSLHPRIRPYVEKEVIHVA